MRPGGIVIDVRDSRAYVSMWERTALGAFRLVEARNWELLEDEAIEEIITLGGFITMSGQYPCGAALAAKAQWG